MASKGPAYGDLAERQAKMAAKYDPELEKSLRDWIQKETGVKLDGSFHEALKDGVALCKLMNRLQPDSVKGIHTGSMGFKQMENIGKFLEACPKYGVMSEYLFQTPDLYEDKNMTGVLTTLDNLRRIQGVKAAGGTVEAQKLKDSVLMPRGKVDMKVEKKPQAVPTRDFYDQTGKDVANSSGGKDGAYGDLAERMATLESKYDKGVEDVLKTWIEHETGEKIGDDFQAGLKDGTILCKLMNKLSPGSIKSINQGKLAFKQMENINNFIQAAQAFGVKNDDVFQTVALFEGSNMFQVQLCLTSLKRVAAQK